MAKKIKFPLQMKNDAQVRDLDELREHFDLDKAIGYFLDGKLLSWLEARYYDTEADAVRALNKDDADVHRRLCEIFGVEYHAEEAPKIDVEVVEERNRRLGELKQYTSDPAVLEKVDQVAFNQEELADLIDEGYSDIYLCNNSFVIPLRVRNKHYIGIGKTEAVIRSQEHVDFDELGIRFDDINFNEEYAKANKETPEELYKLGSDAEDQGLYENAFQYYMQAAERKNVDAMFKVGVFYDYGYGMATDYAKAIEWYRKAADSGHTVAMNNIGAKYEDGKGVEQNKEIAKEWYQKAADLGYAWSMKNLGNIYYNEKKYNLSLEWYQKASDLGDAYSSYSLGWQYEFGQGPTADIQKAQEYYKKAVNGYSSNDPNYDPVFRYGRNLVFVYRDLESARQWFDEQCDTREKKLAVVDYVIQRYRNKPIDKRWVNTSMYPYAQLDWGWSSNYSRSELISATQSTIAKYLNGVVNAYSREQTQYESLIKQEYYYYLIGAVLCGAHNVSINDADGYANSAMQQINQLSEVSIDNPTQDAINRMEIVENLNTGGVFAKRTYRMENANDVERAVTDPVERALKGAGQRVHDFICQSLMDLAADLERMKRSI